MIGYYVLGTLTVLFPVAAYLLYLAMINGRPHPTMIPGPWDFVGVLAALSGFLVVVGPACLWIFHSQWRPMFMKGEVDWMRAVASGELSLLWLVPWGVYLTLVIGGAYLVLLQRRPYTLIYNIDPGTLEVLLGQIFQRLGYEAERVGNRVLVRSSVASHLAEDGKPPLPEATARPAEEASSVTKTAISTTTNDGVVARLDLDIFPAMRHVTLRWRRPQGTIRQDVEAELMRDLLAVETGDNPAAQWLLTIAACLFSAVFLGLVGFILLRLRGY